MTFSQNTLPPGDAPDHSKKNAQKKRPPRKITASYLHNAALYYLQRFPASTAHFRKVMTQKIDRSCRAHSTQDRTACLALLDQLVVDLTSQGLLNDDGYARAMVSSLRRRGLSWRAIHARLSAKGLPAAQITAALEAYDEQEHHDNQSDSEYEAALIFARRKKIGPFRTETAAQATYNKECAKLARAGFSYDIAQKIFNLSSENDETV